MSTCAKFVIPMALIGLLPAAPAVADTTFFNTGRSGWKNGDRHPS